MKGQIIGLYYVYYIVLSTAAVCVLFVYFEKGPQGRLDMSTTGPPL